eukprot:SAG11_NODE_2058_length_3875_cov_2.983051_2_plen_910_part_00
MNYRVLTVCSSKALIRPQVENNRSEVVREMARAGVDLNVRNKDGMSAWWVGAAHGFTEVLFELASEGGADLQANGDGVTPLMWAASAGLSYVAAALLNAAKDRRLELLQATDRTGFNALQHAEHCRHHAVSKILRGAAAAMAGSLFRAVFANSAEAVDAAAKEGADFDGQDCHAESPLKLAVMLNHLDAIQALIKHDAGRTNSLPRRVAALRTAAQRGHADAVRAMLVGSSKEQRLLMESTDPEFGMAALSWSAREGHASVARVLLQAGADTQAKDRYGNTALWYCTELREHPSVARALQEAAQDGNGKKGEAQEGIGWDHAETIALLTEQLLKEKQRALTDLFLSFLSWGTGGNWFWTAFVGLCFGGCIIGICAKLYVDIWLSYHSQMLPILPVIIMVAVPNIIIQSWILSVLSVQAMRWCRPSDQEDHKAAFWTQHFELLCTLALLCDCIGYPIARAGFGVSGVSTSWVDAESEEILCRIVGTLMLSIFWEHIANHLRFALRPHRWLLQTEPRPFERWTLSLFLDNFPHSGAWHWRLSIPAGALSAVFVALYTPGTGIGVLLPIRESLKGICLALMLCEAVVERLEACLARGLRQAPDTVDFDSNAHPPDVSLPPLPECLRRGVQIATQLFFVLAFVCDLPRLSYSFEHLDNNFPGGQYWHYLEVGSGHEGALEQEQQTNAIVPPLPTQLDSGGVVDAFLRSQPFELGHHGVCADEDELSELLAGYADDSVTFLLASMCLLLALCSRHQTAVCSVWRAIQHAGKDLQISAQSVAWQLMDVYRNEPFVKKNPVKATLSGICDLFTNSLNDDTDWTMRFVFRFYLSSVGELPCHDVAMVAAIVDTFSWSCIASAEADNASNSGTTPYMRAINHRTAVNVSRLGNQGLGCVLSGTRLAMLVLRFGGGFPR